MKLFSQFYSNEVGGGLVEYVLIVSLIAIAAVAGMTLTGTKLNTSFSKISNKL